MNWKNTAVAVLAIIFFGTTLFAQNADEIPQPEQPKEPQKKTDVMYNARVGAVLWMNYHVRMDYASGYCSYECNLCGQVCPTGAIRPLALAAKQTVQIGVAHFVRDNCIVYTDHTACGACDEYCPTKAVHMIPYRDGLTIPEVRETLCVGCGACENACPARPHRAIYVDGHPVQQQATRPTSKPLEREKTQGEFPF